MVTIIHKTQCQLCKRLAGPFIPLSWVSLWTWSLGGSQQQFSCVFGHFGHGHKQPTNRLILVQACSWTVWEGSLLQKQQLDNFRMIVRQLWNDIAIGTTLGQLWDNFETTLGLLWNKFCTTLGQSLDRFGTWLRQLYKNFVLCYSWLSVPLPYR